MRGLVPVLDLIGFVVVVGLVHVLVDVGVEARFGLQLHTRTIKYDYHTNNSIKYEANIQ